MGEGHHVGRLGMAQPEGIPDAVRRGQFVGAAISIGEIGPVADEAEIAVAKLQHIGLGIVVDEGNQLRWGT